MCSSLAIVNGLGAPGSGGGMWPSSTSSPKPIVAHGLRSGAPQTASARRPPGRSTRRVSASAAAGSAISMYPNRQSTPSTESASSSMRSASITR